MPAAAKSVWIAGPTGPGKAHVKVDDWPAVVKQLECRFAILNGVLRSDKTGALICDFDQIDAQVLHRAQRRTFVTNITICDQSESGKHLGTEDFDLLSEEVFELLREDVVREQFLDATGRRIRSVEQLQDGSTYTRVLYDDDPIA